VAEKAIKLQRLILGETTENTAHTVERITKQEIDRLIIQPDEPGAIPEDGDEDWYAELQIDRPWSESGSITMYSWRADGVDVHNWM
jgi:hypothetical protein